MVAANLSILPHHRQPFSTYVFAIKFFFPYEITVAFIKNAVILPFIIFVCSFIKRYFCFFEAFLRILFVRAVLNGSSNCPYNISLQKLTIA